MEGRNDDVFLKGMVVVVAAAAVVAVVVEPLKVGKG